LDQILESQYVDRQRTGRFQKEDLLKQAFRAIRRLRADDGNLTLFARRLSLQPEVRMAWLSDAVVRDQGRLAPSAVFETQF
jgi:hypothetical protein